MKSPEQQNDQLLFDVQELVIPATFPRSTPLSTVTDTDRLDVACKLYSPKNLEVNLKNPSVFFVGGNGFAKVSIELHIVNSKSINISRLRKIELTM